jgi:hypothetical protein
MARIGARESSPRLIKTLKQTVQGADVEVIDNEEMSARQKYGKRHTENSEMVRTAASLGAAKMRNLMRRNAKNNAN